MAPEISAVVNRSAMSAVHVAQRARIEQQQRDNHERDTFSIRRRVIEATFGHSTRRHQHLDHIRSTPSDVERAQHTPRSSIILAKRVDKTDFARQTFVRFAPCGYPRVIVLPCL